jgi:hypothetical protein
VREKKESSGTWLAELTIFFQWFMQIGGGVVSGFRVALSTVSQWVFGCFTHCGAEAASVSWCGMNFA